MKEIEKGSEPDHDVTSQGLESAAPKSQLDRSQLKPAKEPDPDKEVINMNTSCHSEQEEPPSQSSQDAFDSPSNSTVSCPKNSQAAAECYNPILLRIQL